MNKTECTFQTRVCMKSVVFSYGWRMLLILAAALFVDFWLLYPKMPIVGIVVGAIAAAIVLFDGVRRMLRCRATLIFLGNNLQMQDYCGSSFRIDGMQKEDLLVVQNPAERHFDTGRLLIRRKGIYLRGVMNCRALRDYIENELTCKSEKEA